MPATRRFDLDTTTFFCVRCSTLRSSTIAEREAPLGLETATLSKVVPYFDFIDGLKSAARRVYDAETSATLAVRGDAFANREATRARREQARAARHD